MDDGPTAESHAVTSCSHLCKISDFYTTWTLGLQSHSNISLCRSLSCYAPILHSCDVEGDYCSLTEGACFADLVMTVHAKLHSSRAMLCTRDPGPLQARVTMTPRKPEILTENNVPEVPRQHGESRFNPVPHCFKLDPLPR